MYIRDALPEDVRRFILASVPSVPYLEAVLLLRSAPAEAWDAAHAARRLYIPEAQAGELLRMMTAAGIAVASEGGARYQPATPELAAVLDRLAETYTSNLVGVTGLIHSRSATRAQQFADAFRLRKDT